MASCKVLVKTSENSLLCSRENLLLLLNNHSVKISRLLPSGSNFNVICSNIDETEKIFNEDVISSLSDGGFSPVLPGELKSSRSVIVRKIDPHIYKNTCNAIEQELVRCNSWCSVTEVIKFHSSFKIVFTSSSMAERCISSGLLLFFLHIPAHNIVKDNFVKLLTCFCCFTVEEHISSNCPKKQFDSSFQVCSKCAATDHDYKSCPNANDKLKCYNCDGEHHAMSNSCYIRKEALRKKRLGKETRKFSDVVRNSNQLNKTVDIDIVNKSIALMFLATLKEVDCPGSFATELNKLYVNNNIPVLNLDGFTPPSLSALRKLTSTNLGHVHQPDTVNVGSSEPMAGLSADGGARPKDTVRPPIPSRPDKLNLSGNYYPPETCLLVSGSAQNCQLSPQPDIWSEFKVFKVRGTKASTNEEILQAWELGNISIVRENGTVPDYNTVMSLISSDTLPKMSIMKRNDFKEMVSSPKRFFNK